MLVGVLLFAFEPVFLHLVDISKYYLTVNGGFTPHIQFLIIVNFYVKNIYWISIDSS